ncbi:MAG: uncharacterized membrane protein YgdD (TMEM256/DUF423 family) [Rhodothermales bacterium]|jgi:uncharacterized membrane protein YgdD (TMEM256/DUF423 family)
MPEGLRKAAGTDYVLAGAVLAGVGVALGAFGAHGLKTVLSTQGLQTFETAVRYQMLHSLALVLVGILVSTWGESPGMRRAGSFFLVGVGLFSGSLYLLLATGMTWLGAVTPFGGVALILGWFSLAAAAVRRRRLLQTGV